MAPDPPSPGRKAKARVKRIGALASFLAVLSVTAVLMAWMFAGVAEHPGLPRDVGPLPPWFAGGPADVTARKAPAAPSVATPSPGLPSPADTSRADDYVQVVGSAVSITLKEYRLVPDRIRVRPALPAITFVLRNDGRFAHNFHIEGDGVDTTSSKFGPGRTVRLEVTLREGEYQISCPLSNHDQRGMHGTLLVTSEPEGG